MEKRRESVEEECIDPMCDKEKLEEIFTKYDEGTSIFTLKGRKCWGRVVDVYDGDTIKIILPIFGEFLRFNARLDGIDTAEIKSTDDEIKKLAKKAKERLKELIAEKQNMEKKVCIVWVECLEWDKYGRLLVNIYKKPGGESLAKILIKENLAYEYDGGRKKNESEILELNKSKAT